MRLNCGLPVWHVSTSIQDPKRGALVHPALAERHSIDALAGVGGDREWWIYSPARVGHLRVPVTAEETALLPTGVAEDDAGGAGTERPRTPSKGSANAHR